MRLEISDISLSFDGKRILKDISLSIEEGEFLALMGPNGSGKTTLLRCIMNYLRPEEGAVLMDARPIHLMPDRDLARLFAVVPQNSQIDFSFTAYEMVMMGRLPYSRQRSTSAMESIFLGDSRADALEVRSAMERTNTWQFAGRQFLTLSGGERQRVIIARALAQKPRVLLLDEPTVYLDITGQLEIMDLLKKLNQEGMTIIAVLHDINMASRYSRKIALLHDGRLESCGAPEEVFTPENILRIYDVDVIVRRDPLTHSVSVIPKTAVAIPAAHGTRVHVLCGGGSGGPILNDLLEAGYSPSAGAVNVLDSDFEMAKSLRIPIVTEVPFSQIGEEADRQNMNMIGESGAVIVAGFPIGPGNIRNLEAAGRALEAGKTVIIMDPDTVDERDFVGGKAKRIVEDYFSRGALPAKDRRQAMQMLGERLKK